METKPIYIPVKANADEFRKVMNSAVAISKKAWAETTRAGIKIGKAYSGSTQEIKTTSRTIDVMRSHVQSLTSELEKTKIGSSRFKELSRDLRKANKELDVIEKQAGLTGNTFDQLKDGIQAIGAGSAFAIMGGEIKDLMDKAQNFENTMKGLTAVVKHNLGEDAVPQAIDSVNKLGVALNLTDDAMATSLKNLVAMGFSIEEANKLIESTADQAVTGRQAHLSMAEAVQVFTEGLKNNNSTLTDSAGYTENLSVAFKKLGINYDQLTDKQGGAAARQKFVNYYLQQGSAFAGDARRNVEGYAGAMGKIERGAEKAQIGIGKVYKDGFLPLLNIAAEGSIAFGTWANDLGAAGKSLIMAGTAAGTLATGIYTLQKALELTGITAGKAWMKILGPIGLGIAAATFVITAYVEYRDEKAKERIENIKKDIKSISEEQSKSISKSIEEFTKAGETAVNVYKTSSNLTNAEYDKITENAFDNYEKLRKVIKQYGIEEKNIFLQSGARGNDNNTRVKDYIANIEALKRAMQDVNEEAKNLELKEKLDKSMSGAKSSSMKIKDLSWSLQELLDKASEIDTLSEKGIEFGVTTKDINRAKELKKELESINSNISVDISQNYRPVTNEKLKTKKDTLEYDLIVRAPDGTIIESKQDILDKLKEQNVSISRLPVEYEVTGKEKIDEANISLERYLTLAKEISMEGKGQTLNFEVNPDQLTVASEHLKAILANVKGVAVEIDKVTEKTKDGEIEAKGKISINLPDGTVLRNGPLIKQIVGIQGLQPVDTPVNVTVEGKDGLTDLRKMLENTASAIEEVSGTEAQLQFSVTGDDISEAKIKELEELKKNPLIKVETKTTPLESGEVTTTYTVISSNPEEVRKLKDIQNLDGKDIKMKAELSTKEADDSLKSLLNTISGYTQQIGSQITTFMANQTAMLENQLQDFQGKYNLFSSLMSNHYDNLYEDREEYYDKAIEMANSKYDEEAAAFEELQQKKIDAERAALNERIIILDEELAAKKEALEAEFDQRIEASEQEREQRLSENDEKTEDQLAQKQNELDIDNYYSNEKEWLNEERERAIADLISGYTDQKEQETQISNENIQTIEEENSNKLTGLEEEKNNRIAELEAQKEKELQKIQKEREEREKAAAKLSAMIQYGMSLNIHKQQQQQAIATVGINLATGIMTAWSQAMMFMPLTPIIGALMTGLLTGVAASSLSMIASQPPPLPPAELFMREGGFVYGQSHEQGGVKAELEGGEYVMPVSRTRDYLPELEAMRRGQYGGQSVTVVFEQGAVLISGIQDHDELFDQFARESAYRIKGRLASR